jgi:cell wall-associated NlpC family hydrolase
LRRWLKKYGVGIDCSGFVQQALRRLIEVSRAEVGKAADRESELEKGLLRCEWVYKNIMRDARYGERAFVEVPIPTKSRPGDVVAFKEDRAESEYVIDRCREIEQLWSITGK